MVYANDDILDMFSGLPCNMFSLPLSIPILNNPYHKRCDALRSFLVDNDFSIECVSRSHIGEKWYYNIRLNKHTFLPDIDLKQLLNIDNIGLVYYDTKTKHSIILIDEDELHEKYLQGESLNLDLSSDFIQAIKDKNKVAIIEILTNYSDTIDCVDIDFAAGLLSIIAPIGLGMKILVDKLFKKELYGNQFSIIDTGDDELKVYILKYEELLSDGC